MGLVGEEGTMQVNHGERVWVLPVQQMFDILLVLSP